MPAHSFDKVLAQHAPAALPLAPYFFSRVRIIPPLDISRDLFTPDDLAKATAERNGTGPLASIVGGPSAAIETVARFQAPGARSRRMGASKYLSPTGNP